MRFSHNLLFILNILGAAQALLLACALFSTKRGNRTANRLLAAFAAAIAVSVGGVALVKTPYINSVPYLSKIHQPFTLLGAPLLFLYVRTLFLRKREFERKDLLHFIPFALCALYLIPYYLQSGVAKLDINFSVYYGTRWYAVRSAFLLLQFLVYLSLIYLMLVRYSRPKSAGQEAAPNKNILFQARFLLIAFTAMWMIGVLHYTASLLSTTYFYTPEADLILPLCLTAFVYALAYLGLRKPEALTVTVDLAPAKRYETPSLTPERSERYMQKLLHCMETEKPFTDGDLTLKKLAKKLSVPPQYLSRVINERLNQNFVDFINTYRIEEAKKRLIDPARKHYSVLAIAEEVGFNSKSSFNLVFKKHTSMTPSEFRKAAIEKR
ncbi:MAG: AraC family transcriptional regulator [Pyrinomonadaceae bacterium]|nr:AraC family transcriptional regulator [Pyrinomonadaceae bacterium]